LNSLQHSYSRCIARQTGRPGGPWHCVSGMQGSTRCGHHQGQRRRAAD
jgi:hypothetical protein